MSISPCSSAREPAAGRCRRKIAITSSSGIRSRPWFEKYSGSVLIQTIYAVIPATASNCTGQTLNIQLSQGTYQLTAGFVDEYGRYNYSPQGTITVN